MEIIIWAILMAVIWTNNEILGQHMKNGTKPTYNFWISVIFTIVAFAGWIVVRFSN